MLGSKKLTHKISLINGNNHEASNVMGLFSYVAIPTISIFVLISLIVALTIANIFFIRRNYNENKAD